MLNLIRGYAGAYIAYPIAEIVEKRNISSKIDELRKYYKLPFEQRKVYATDKLIQTLNFAKIAVPYYKDLFKQINFDPDCISKDIKYLEDIPYLTKEIINEQKERLLSTTLDSIRYHERKTGGSTGVSAMIYYDQIGLDYSAAITRYCRDMIGASAHKSEIHFAAAFAKPPSQKIPSKDDVKNFALNRSNIFFDKLDNVGFNEIWETILKKKPYLIHGHPSTLYALACYLEDKNIKKNIFEVFESSGELLQEYMREKICNVFGCRVVDRYGSAEFGVIGYELEKGLKILDSEGWPESKKTDLGNELVFTGFRNRLMPLIRYATGDMSRIVEKEDGFYMTEVVGRIHDMVSIKGIDYPTHSIMDVLDHKVGGIREFQIDIRGEKPILKIALENTQTPENVSFLIKNTWLGEMDLEFIDICDFIRVGERAKFRHVVK
jgi:phenylacetate-CoA ligase